MIAIDFETTNLLGPKAAYQADPNNSDCRIIEYTAIKLQPQAAEVDWVEVDRISSLVNPGQPIPEKAQEITGISNADVKGKETFENHFEKFAEFFLGEAIMVAHNIAFDAAVLELELRRLGMEFHFPWPRNRLCTMTAAHEINNRRMRLGELYELVTQLPFDGAHRSANDVEALIPIINWLTRENKWRIPECSFQPEQ